MVSKKMIWFILGVLVLMAACAPMTTTFYRPTAPEGKIAQAFCPPVESIIIIEINGVIISTRASYSSVNWIGERAYPSTNKIEVTIGFEVPEGRTVALENQKIASMLDDKIIDSQDLLGRTWVSRGHTEIFETTSPMIGKVEKRIFWPHAPYSGSTDNSYYWFSAKIFVPQTETFIIKLPDFLVNDLKVEPPLISFTIDESTYIGSLNC